MTTYIQEIRQALAVTITDADIKALVDTTRKKALHNTAIAAELRSLPENKGKATFSIRQCYSLYQLWRIILLGTYNCETPIPQVRPFISLNIAIHWLRIIFSTLDKHFSGEIAEVGKINAINFLYLFVYDMEKGNSQAKDNKININCAAQFLMCASLAAYWSDVSTFILI